MCVHVCVCVCVCVCKGSQSVVDGCGHMAQESECRKAFVSFLPGIATGLSLFMNTEALAGQVCMY